MAGKRGATSDLNHDNWDREEAPEESGSFQRAPDDSLKRRIIKTARRRNPISSVRDSGDAEKKNAFTSFGGFGKTAPPTSSAFSFLSNLTTPKTPPKINGVEGNSEKEKAGMSTSKFNSNPFMSNASESNKSSGNMLSWTQQTEYSEKIATNIFSTNATNNNSKDNNSSNSSPDKSNNYYPKLKGLNQSVSNWIKKHVDANPFINLQPIFRDYENHFIELEKEKILKPPDTGNQIEISPGSFVFKPTTIVPDSTTEKSQSDSKFQPKKNEANKIPNFSFETTVAATTAPSFSFGNAATKVSATGSFSTTTTKESTKTNIAVSSFTFGVKPPNSTTSEATKPVNATTSSFTFTSTPPTTASPPTTKAAPHTTAAAASLFTFGVKSPSSPVSSVASIKVTKSSDSTLSKVTFGIPSSSTTKDATKTTPSFSFGAVTSSSSPLGTAFKGTTKVTSTTTPSFSFGTMPTNSTIPPFSSSTISPFSSSTPFMFGNVAKPISSDDKNKDAEEVEEPPKNEFTPVIEKDHVYTIRCKVFVKKDGKFGDRGVGNLFLKPVADSEKFQLIVRADTNLGNLLLNIILSESVPTKKLGTKDVMLVCVPTPEAEPPPVPVLLRVKSTEEADKLLETLEKYKK